MSVYRLSYILLGLSLLLFFLDTLGMLNFVKEPVDSVVIPVKSAVYDTWALVKGAGNVVWEYKDIKNIADQRSKLAKENEELKRKVFDLTGENAAMRHQLGAPLPPTLGFIPGNVIGKSRYLEVSVGEKDGVKKDMTVVDGTIFIGKTVNVSPLRSSIILPTDSDLKIPAKTSRGTEGTVIGEFGSSVLLDKVLQKDQLFLNDQVVTTGAGGYPPNLLIGKITHISADDVSPYKQAAIEPPLDYGREQTVFIVSSL